MHVICVEVKWGVLKDSEASGELQLLLLLYYLAIIFAITCYFLLQAITGNVKLRAEYFSAIAITLSLLY